MVDTAAGWARLKHLRLTEGNTWFRGVALALARNPGSHQKAQWLGGVPESEGCVLHQLIVLRMGADPEPHNQHSFAPAQSPIALVDSDRPDILLQWFEMDRWMKAVLLP